jgi:mono/diheme cytochrome c family protein
MKIVKRVLLVLALLVALVVLALVVKFYVLSPKMRAATDVKAPSTPEAIERGRYLANHVAACMGCHSEVDEDQPGEPMLPGRIGSGRDFGNMPGFPGRMRAANLTPDPETGIGNISDGMILRAMREGIGHDGHVLFPFMPYRSFAKLSDADALAIIAYLRTLLPLKRKLEPSTVIFPVKMFVRAVPAPVVDSPPAEPPASDPVARGQWLITMGNCHDCHDAFNGRHEPLPGKELSGGFEFISPTGKGSVFAANITSDKATGIGAYTDEDLLRALTDGVSKSGRKLYAMPWRYYGGMTDEDKRAVIAALRKVPPVMNAVPAAKLNH